MENHPAHQPHRSQDESRRPPVTENEVEMEIRANEVPVSLENANLRFN